MAPIPTALRVLAKFSKFASARLSRHILGQPRSTLDWAELIREERILLVSCAAGVVGADLAAFLGSVLVGLFQHALAEQARLHPGARHRFLVLIDEFQVLGGVDYQTMLAELRKYGGSFGLATQSLAYLERFSRTLRSTVLANIEHTFAFAMAEQDVRLLPLAGVEPEDLLHLPDYTCYARLSLAGQRLPVFSLQLDAPPPPDEAQQARLREQSRLRYGRPVGEVEQSMQTIQARRALMPSVPHRTEEAGEEVSWTRGERVLDVVDRLRGTRKRGSGSGGTKASSPGQLAPAEQVARPEHTMYASATDLDEAQGQEAEVVPQENDAQEEREEAFEDDNA